MHRIPRLATPRYPFHKCRNRGSEIILALQIHEATLGFHKMDDSLLQHLWMQKIPSSIKKGLVCFKEDELTAELTEAVDRMFDVDLKSSTVVTLPFTRPAYSIMQLKEQMDHLRIQPGTFIRCSVPSNKSCRCCHQDFGTEARRLSVSK